jgi:hypothetical protein
MNTRGEAAVEALIDSGFSRAYARLIANRVLQAAYHAVPTTSAADALAGERVFALMEELERERTQNRELRAAFQEYVDATGPWMKSQADNLNHPLTKAVNAARAALSTQEESK